MISENKSKLERLQIDENFLFHGSGLRILELEPRQPYTIIDGVKTADGEPAVYASQFIDYAIFMALINKETCSSLARSSCSYENGQLIFGATQETLDQLSEDTIGYVHVLHKSAFTLRNDSEWFSVDSQKPHEIVEVRRADFTKPINIINSDFSIAKKATD